MLFGFLVLFLLSASIGLLIGDKPGVTVFCCLVATVAAVALLRDWLRGRAILGLGGPGPRARRWRLGPKT